VGQAISVVGPINADHEHDDALYAGARMVIWEGKDKRGAAVLSGICFLRLKTEEYQAVRRLVKCS